jgi:hypothetical protein
MEFNKKVWATISRPNFFFIASARRKVNHFFVAEEIFPCCAEALLYNYS